MFNLMDWEESDMNLKDLLLSKQNILRISLKKSNSIQHLVTCRNELETSEECNLVYLLGGFQWK